MNTPGHPGLTRATHLANSGSPSLALAQLNSAGGGRAVSACLTEPGSYEDFHYPSPFDYTSFAASSPNPNGPPSRPFSPFASTHHRLPSNPFSPLPTFSPYPSHSSPSSAALSHPPLQPSPPAPAPLFDSDEQALFSSFLTTMEVNDDFLFNPVLPPGMPSPPSLSLLYPPGAHEDERREREELGMEVGGMNLNQQMMTPSSPFDLPEPVVTHSNPAERLQRYAEYEEDGAEQETATPSGDEGEEKDDPDFDPAPPPAGPRGIRRKSRGSTSGPAGGKKSRTQPLEAEEPVFPAEDAEMASLPGWNGTDAHEEPVTACPSSGRPRRSTRAPRRLSGTSSSSTRPRSSSRPSLSRAAAPPSAPVPNATVSSTSTSNSTSSTSSRSRSTASTSLSPPPPQTKPSALAPAPAPLSVTEKRSNHIASEQRRRTAIKNGFQDLVDLLGAGSGLSGIAVGVGDDASAGGGRGGTRTGGKGKKGATARGRGRKGEVATNASKSVVLGQAAQYVLWLERGNLALEGECERVEKEVREAGTRVGA
ncbi:hypothetical protein JCM11641_007378 [Rhodosporidiobolus odoratus]